MAAYSQQNLCATVEPRYTYATLPCTVGHEIDPYQNGGRTWAFSHQWPRRPEGNLRREGHCLNCGLTVKEVRVRVNPKTGEPIRKGWHLAHAIAIAARDVPPVQFTGATR